MKTITPPYGLVLFADDIRQEIGNKASLVGLYGDEMILAAGTQLPVVIPKLGVWIRWNEPVDGFAKMLTFKTILCKFDAPPESDEGQQLAEFSVDLAKVVEGRERPAHSISIRLEPAFVLPPFTVKEESRLRVRVYRDGEQWAIARLLIRVAATVDEAAAKQA
jgi:hypothetical protein